MAALPSAIEAVSFLVSWSGSDDANGSGIAAYDLFVSVDGGAFTPWLVGTDQTAATYQGAFDHTYAFFSLALDQVGHRQAMPAGAQANTTLRQRPQPPPPPTVHPSGVSLIKQGRAGRKKLAARVTFSDGSLRVIRSPFQKPRFSRSVAVLLDQDGDGIFDGVLFRAIKNKKKVNRAVAL